MCIAGYTLRPSSYGPGVSFTKMKQVPTQAPAPAATVEALRGVRALAVAVSLGFIGLIGFGI